MNCIQLGEKKDPEGWYKWKIQRIALSNKIQTTLIHHAFNAICIPKHGDDSLVWQVSLQYQRVEGMWDYGESGFVRDTERFLQQRLWLFYVYVCWYVHGEDKRDNKIDHLCNVNKAVNDRTVVGREEGLSGSNMNETNEVEGQGLDFDWILICLYKIGGCFGEESGLWDVGASE